MYSTQMMKKGSRRSSAFIGTTFDSAFVCERCIAGWTASKRGSQKKRCEWRCRGSGRGEGPKEEDVFGVMLLVARVK